jgi:hypothetical protein
MAKNKDKVPPFINRKILVGCLIVIAIGAILIGVSPQSKISSSINKIAGNIQSAKDTVNFIVMNERKQQIIETPKKDLLFNVTITYDENNHPQYVDIEKKPELSNFYKQVGYANESQNTVFVYPVFTQGAYGNNGFYDYYNKKCGPECLTLPIPSTFIPKYAASMSATMVLSLLNYSYITDVDVDKNPDILKKYHKVIILHNEYVTKREFDAITGHPNVLYLFPNALYAEVRADYAKNTFTFDKGTWLS